MILSTSLWTPKRFAEKIGRDNYLNGGYLGLVFVMALYNLFLFLTNKEAAYAFYTLYISSIGLAVASIFGIAQEFVPPSLKFFADRPAIFVTCGGTFLVLFPQAFLMTADRTPKLHRVLMALVAISIVGTIVNLAGKYSTGIRMTSLLMILILPMLISPAIYSMLTGFRAARFYVASFLVLILGGMAFGLRNLGVLPHNFLTYNGFQIGSALEIVLLSLALADRMNLMKKDKEAAQRETLENQVTLTRSYARFVPEQFMALLTRRR